MNIFVTVKKNFASIGFIQGKGRFDLERWLRIFEGFLAIIMQCLYLVFDADTDEEYMDSMFMTTVGIFIYVCFLSVVLKTEMIFITIDEIQQFVNESKFNIHV